MDLAHRDVERRLAHLRQPNKDGLLVDARPIEVAAQETEHASHRTVVAGARGHDEVLPATRFHVAERAAEFIRVVQHLTTGPKGTGNLVAEICRQNQRPQPYRHDPSAIGSACGAAARIVMRAGLAAERILNRSGGSGQSVAMMIRPVTAVQVKAPNASPGHKARRVANRRHRACTVERTCRRACEPLPTARRPPPSAPRRLSRRCRIAPSAA